MLSPHVKFSPEGGVAPKENRSLLCPGSRVIPLMRISLSSYPKFSALFPEAPSYPMEAYELLTLIPCPLYDTFPAPGPVALTNPSPWSR